MSDEIEDQKRVEFYSAGLAAWYATRLEHDKSLLTLSAGGIGLLMTPNQRTPTLLYDIDPYTYLVDVLQRVGPPPDAEVAQLTPRLWDQHFAANPLRSELLPRSK